MQLDNQKILLLRCYSRSYSHNPPRRLNKKYASPSQLELFLPRTSSPTMESHLYTDDNDIFDHYEIFRTILGVPMKKAKVRGMDKAPYHFISGHLIPSPNERLDYTPYDLNPSMEKIPKKVTLQMRFDDFKKTVKNFFRKYYRQYIRNKCDYSICPPTCECQKVKSFLNKTIVVDDEEIEIIESW